MTMATAMKKAGVNVKEGEFARYKVSNHAESRAVSRLGIKKEHASAHLLMLMQTAYYQGQGSTPLGPSRIYDHHNSRTRLIINTVGDTIITVYKMSNTADLAQYDISFLKPILEREHRKLKRQHTKAVREEELDKALLLRDYGEMAVNHAMARNPNTRSLIEGRMEDAQEELHTIDKHIVELKGTYAEKSKAIEEMMAD